MTSELAPVSLTRRINVGNCQARIIDSVLNNTTISPRELHNPPCPTHAVIVLKIPSVIYSRIACKSTFGCVANAVVKCTTVCATLSTAQTRNTLLVIHLAVFFAARRPPRCTTGPDAKGRLVSVPGVKETVTGGTDGLRRRKKGNRRGVGGSGANEVPVSRVREEEDCWRALARTARTT